MRATSLFTRLTLAALAAALITVPAGAATLTWNGASAANGNWSTGSNWVGGVAATGTGSGDTLIFGNGTLRPSSTNTVNNFLLSGAQALRFTSAANYSLSGSSVVLGGNVSQTAASNVTIGMDVKLSATRTFALSNAGGTVNVTGVVSNQAGAAGLSKTLGGTLILSANNTYTGDTSVTGGTLVVNGTNLSSNVFVGGGAVLRGVGSVGDVTVDSGSVISAGTSAVGGVLQVKSLSLLPDAQSQFTITGTSLGTQYNSVRSTGNVDYGSSTVVLNFPNATQLPHYSTYKLFDAASYSSNIAGIPNVNYVGDDLSFSETTEGSGVWKAYSPTTDQTLIFATGNGTLTVVPEPSSIVMLAMAGGVAGVFGMRRRKNQKSAATT